MNSKNSEIIEKKNPVFTLTMPLNVHEPWSTCGWETEARNPLCCACHLPLRCVHIPIPSMRGWCLKYGFLYIMAPKPNQQLHLVLNQRYSNSCSNPNEETGWSYSERSMLDSIDFRAQSLCKIWFYHSKCTYPTNRGHSYVELNEVFLTTLFL